MKKVVFDFGGVLFRWQPARLLARVWPHRVPHAEHGGEVVAEFFQAYGGDWGAFDQGLIGSTEVVRRIAARTGWPAAEIQAVVDAVPSELAVVPETVELLLQLREAGHGLHFLSNMPEPFADHLEQGFPLHEWFESGLFSGRVKQSKPGAAIFDLAEQRFEAKPGELVFLDDHPANIDAANARGWTGVLFTDATKARAQLQGLGLLSA